MTPDELPWTTAHDDALRSELAAVESEADEAALAEPAFVRAAGDRMRRRRMLAWTAAAAAAVVVVAGVGFALIGRTDDRRPVIATQSATPTASGSPTASATPSPTGSPSPSQTPTTEPTPPAPADPVVSDTRVIGEDGALGPFRVGMTRREVEAAISDAGLTDTVRIQPRDMGGGGMRDVVVQDGVDTGFGDLGLIASFRDGRVEALFAPTGASIRGAGVGDPVSAFTRVFPGQVAADTDSGVYVLTLENGTRLQLGSPSAFNDPSSVRSIVILPPGTTPFYEFA